MIETLLLCVVWFIAGAAFWHWRDAVWVAVKDAGAALRGWIAKRKGGSS